MKVLLWLPAHGIGGIAAGRTPLPPFTGHACGQVFTQSNGRGGGVAFEPNSQTHQATQAQPGLESKRGPHAAKPARGSRNPHQACHARVVGQQPQHLPACAMAQERDLVPPGALQQPLHGCHLVLLTPLRQRRLAVFEWASARQANASVVKHQDGMALLGQPACKAQVEALFHTRRGADQNGKAFSAVCSRSEEVALQWHAICACDFYALGG